MSFSLKASKPAAGPIHATPAATPRIDPAPLTLKRELNAKKAAKAQADFDNAEQLTRAYTPEEIQAALDKDPTQVTPKAKGLGGFNFKPKPSTPAPTATAPSAKGPVQDAAPQESQEASESPPPTLMPNEVPADAVVRELADDASPGVLKFVEMLDSVPKLFHDPDTLGQVIRNIMQSLSKEESFIQMVQPDDYKFIIRGMRDVLEGAAIKKASTKRKSPSKKKPKKTDLDSDDLAMLDDLMSGI